MNNIKFSNPKKALVVIDMQEDYTGENARNPFPYKNADKLINQINQLIDKTSKKNMLVVYVRQEFEGFIGKTISRLIGHGTAIKGNAGTELDKRINIVSDFCFSKPMPDAFTNKKFGDFLKEHQVTDLFLVGLDAAGCVLCTAKGALKLGYNVTIIKDGIALLEENKWGKVIEKYKQEGFNLITSNEFMLIRSEN